MPEFYKRTLFGALYAAVVIGLLMWSFNGLILLAIAVSSFCIYEFMKLRGSAEKLPLFFAFLLNLLILGLNDYNQFLHFLGSWETGIAQIIAVFLLAFLFLLRQYRLDAGQHLGQLGFALVYITLPFLLLLNLRSFEAADYNYQWPLLCFILVWTSDTCAYIAGKLMGRRPLFPEISPGKTIEGFIGGTILSAGVGALLSLWFKFMQPLDGIILGMLVSCAGTLGDLFESSLKRKAGVKDSGNVIPGHGGLLDRFDAFLFAVPAVFMYFVIVLKV